jgi:hypothetical protein
VREDAVLRLHLASPPQLANLLSLYKLLRPLLLTSADSSLRAMNYLKQEKSTAPLISILFLLSFALSHSLLQLPWNPGRTGMTNDIFL